MDKVSDENLKQLVHTSNDTDPLTVENIIRATFSNPNRRKFAQSNIQSCNYPLRPDNIDPEALIQRITAQMSIALQRFTQQKIQIYDTSVLNSEVDKTQWLEDLKKLKWYGPFSDDGDDNYYIFQTATDLGNFEGLLLQINLDGEVIVFRYLDKEGDNCGSHYYFDSI